MALAAMLAAASVCPGEDGSRVLWMSFDGLGQQMLETDPAARELRSIRQWMRTAARAAGLRAAYPSTTANSHAALWTGTYAGSNGVLYNRNPFPPESGHAIDERRNGFRSEGLEAEPVWLTAARQGVSVVAHQVTQAYPFLRPSVGDQPYRQFLVANSYQSRQFSPWRVLRRRDVKASTCEQWFRRVPNVSRCAEWGVAHGSGEIRLHLATGRGAVYVALDPARSFVRVEAKRAETSSPRGRSLGRHWSKPLPVPGLPDGVAASLIFRLFELDEATGEFVLLLGPLQEMAVYGAGAEDKALARRLIEEAGPAAGNGAHGLYLAGELGALLEAGGDGAAEDRYLETVEWVVRQQIAHSGWLDRMRRARLHITYLPFPDETDHTWLGLDRRGDARFTRLRARAYALIDRAAEAFLGLARHGDHVILTSDHGMAPVFRTVKVRAALRRAGLEAMAATAGTCVVLNTTDWKGGTLDSASRPAVRERVVRALGEIRDQGRPVISKIYAGGSGLEQFGLRRRADLCFDTAPGYGVSESLVGELVEELKRPKGEHGFDPLRPDMLAVLIVRGPRAGAAQWPVLPSSAVAPLVTDLLGIRPPAQSSGASPLVRH